MGSETLPHIGAVFKIVDEGSQKLQNINQGMAESAKSLANLGGLFAVMRTGEMMSGLGNAMLGITKEGIRMGSTFQELDLGLKIMLERAGQLDMFDVYKQKVIEVATSTTLMTREVMGAARVIGMMSNNMALPFKQMKDGIGGVSQTLLQTYADFIAWRRIGGDYIAQLTGQRVIRAIAGDSIRWGQLAMLLDELYTADLKLSVQNAKDKAGRIEALFQHLTTMIGGLTLKYLETLPGALVLLKDQYELIMGAVWGRGIVYMLYKPIREATKMLSAFLDERNPEFQQFWENIKITAEDLGQELGNIVTRMGKITMATIEWAKENPKVASSLLKWTAYLGAGLYVGGKLLSTLGGIGWSIFGIVMGVKYIGVIFVAVFSTMGLSVMGLVGGVIGLTTMIWKFGNLFSGEIAPNIARGLLLIGLAGALAFFPAYVGAVLLVGALWLVFEAVRALWNLFTDEAPDSAMSKISKKLAEWDKFKDKMNTIFPEGNQETKATKQFKSNQTIPTGFEYRNQSFEDAESQRKGVYNNGSQTSNETTINNNQRVFVNTTARDWDKILNSSFLRSKY